MRSGSGGKGNNSETDSMHCYKQKRFNCAQKCCLKFSTQTANYDKNETGNKFTNYKTTVLIVISLLLFCI